MEDKCMFHEQLDHYYNFIDLGFKPKDAFFMITSDVIEVAHENDYVEEALNFLLSLFKTGTNKLCPCGKNCIG